MPRPVFLITGAGGRLAPFLAEAATRVGTVVTTARSSGPMTCDLSDAAATAALVASVAPDVVLHAAGMTDVDGCESNPDAALRGNADSTRNLARSIRGEARLVDRKSTRLNSSH